MDYYRAKKAVVCCGQGDWEQPATTWRMKEIFEQKGIPVWVDLWGYDVCHDWPWWYSRSSTICPTCWLTPGRAFPGRLRPAPNVCVLTAPVRRRRAKRGIWRNLYEKLYLHLPELPHQLLAVLP